MTLSFVIAVVLAESPAFTYNTICYYLDWTKNLDFLRKYQKGQTDMTRIAQHFQIIATLAWSCLALNLLRKYQ
jgi:hypothetical protein